MEKGDTPPSEENNMNNELLNLMLAIQDRDSIKRDERDVANNKQPSTPKNKNNRKSEIRMLVQHLKSYFFDFGGFEIVVNNMKDANGNYYQESGRKNRVTAICRIFNEATDDELIRMYILHLQRNSTMGNINYELFSSDEVPKDLKVRIIRHCIEPFHRRNTENGAARPNAPESVSEEDRRNWVYHSELQNAFTANYNDVIHLLDEGLQNSEDVKKAYCWGYIAITAFLGRVPRADHINIHHRNYEKKDMPYIDKQWVIHIPHARKTGHFYQYQITDNVMIRTLLKKLIERSERLGSDMIFAGLKGKTAFSDPSSFHRTYVKDEFKRVFNKKFMTRRLRIAIATRDYQVWQRKGGNISQLLRLATRFDHDLDIHFRSYIKEEMVDPDLKEYSIFGQTDFEHGYELVEEFKPEKATAEMMQIE